MPHRASTLRLYLFGEPRFQRGEEQISAFRFDKVRGLLAYLAIGGETVHRREFLAHLLWPSSSPDHARSNLRYALFDLRRVLEDDAERLLKISRDTLHFRTSLLGAFDYVDFLAELPQPVSDADPLLERLERQAAIYVAPLLDGLSIDDAPAFDRWLADRREDALGRALALHERLADFYEAAGRLDDALRHVRRQVALAPWRESDYRRLMKLLAAQGKHPLALQEFEACRRYLAQELGVEPDSATIELAESLKSRQRGTTTTPALLPERQQRLPVTALVCHLRLPDDVNPEDVGDVLKVPRDLVAQVVAERGGYFVPLHGGVLAAYFGYPVAHEFMPRRALDAAFEISAKVAAYPDVISAIGVHTGWMLADSQFALPDVSGDLTRRAAALAASGADQVVIASTELCNALKGFFHFLPLDTECARVVARTRASHRLEAAEELTPLVGRREEIRQLIGAWEQAAEGRFPRIVIQGEPGIGKSRLLAALTDAVAQRGGRVCALRCDADHTQTPYAPFADYLRRRYGDDVALEANERLARLETAVRETDENLLSLLPVFAAILHLPSAFDAIQDAGERKRRVEASLLTLFLSTGSDQPGLVTIEDLHWADPSTLALLQRFLQQLGPWQAPGLMLVATSRSTAGLVETQLMPLSRLPAEQALEMAQLVSGGGVVSVDRLKTAVVRAEGIPLFIEQMMRAATLDADIPLTLRDLLAARLVALGEDNLHAAQCAAVMGREFEAELLTRLCDVPRDILDEGLRNMRRGGLVMDKGEGRFAFSHALIGDAAYLSLPAPERRSLHLRLARLLESASPQWATEHPEAIARHLDLAGHADAAAAWLAAGRFMAGQSAFAEALTHYESGIAALDRVLDDVRRADTEFRLRIGIGNALVAIKGYGSEESHASFVKAQALSSRLSNDADLFQLMWGLWMGGRSATGESPPLEFLEKLAEVAQGATDPAIQLQLNYAHGNNYFWVGKQDLARQHFDLAYALIPKVDGAILAAQYGEDGCITTRALLAWALWIQGDFAAAEAMSAEAIAAGRESGHAHSLGFAMTCAALLYRFLGMPAKVAEICQELLALSEANGMLLWQASAAGLLGWARCTAGDEEGLGLIRMGLAGAQQAMQIVECTFLAFLAESLCRLGRPEEALPVVEESIAKAKLREDVYYLSEFLRMKGEIHLHVTEDAETAAACFQQALQVARTQSAPALELRAAMSLAALWHKQGRPADAVALLGPCCKAFSKQGDYPDLLAARHLLSQMTAAC